MTEQEAEALAARLTRMWPEQRIMTHEPFVFKEGNTTVIASEWGHVSLLVDDEGLTLYTENWFYWFTADWNGDLTQSQHDESTIRGATQVRFESSWLNIFRRNSWLSGFPIEASAHEKAEWIRGFSAEEIEAWDLKM